MFDVAMVLVQEFFIDKMKIIIQLLTNIFVKHFEI